MPLPAACGNALHRNNNSSSPQRFSNRKRPRLSGEDLVQCLEEFVNDSDSDLEESISGSESEYCPSESDGDNDLEQLDVSVSSDTNISVEQFPDISLPSTSGESTRNLISGCSRGRSRGRRHVGLNRGARARTAATRRKQTDEQLGWKTDDDGPAVPIFSGSPGINVVFNEASTPFDVYLEFFGEDLFKHIKCQTNTYARQQIAKAERKGPLQPRTLLYRWKAVTISEIYLVFAIIIHMSLVKKPKMSDYWSQSDILRTTFCGTIGMSRDRFMDIFTMLHLNDNDTYVPRNEDNHDPLYKVRPLIDKLQEAFVRVYTPGEKMTIDEGICPFRSRVYFRVYIKNKPEKYRIKLYELCEANSGYVYRFEVYTGARATDAEETMSEGPVISMIHRLLQPLYNKGYTIYMDRFFSSPILFDKLWNHGTKAVGTVMSNRKELPSESFSTKLKKGEFVNRRREHLLATKWKDKRDVFTLSTVHKGTMEDAVQRGQHEKRKPTAVLDYNKNKVGVDRSDQSLAYYSFRRRSVKWWKKFFMHLFDLSIVNSWVIYKKLNHGQYKPLEKFYESIALSLVEKAGCERIDVPISTGAARLQGRDHFPIQIPATACSPKGFAQRRCKVCSDRGKSQTGKPIRKDTTIMCEKCAVPLCLFGCFKDFHMKSNYV